MPLENSVPHREIFHRHILWPAWQGLFFLRTAARGFLPRAISTALLILQLSLKKYLFP